MQAIPIPLITFFIIFHLIREHKAGNMNNEVQVQIVFRGSHTLEGRG